MKLETRENSAPKISVIVPVYKVEKYLRKCIDSVLNQTFQDFELILVSDGPEEDHKICEEYISKDSRITLIKDIKKGLGGARNAGLELAKGEYIIFIDSDDWIEADTLEKSYKSFDKDIDLVVFGCNIVYESGLRKKSGLERYFNLKYTGKHCLEKNIIFNTNVSVWNKLWKKSIIDKYKIRFPENMQYEDFPFYFQYCMYAKKTYYLNENLYNYLQRADSGMNETYNHNYEYIVDHINGCRYLYKELVVNNSFKDNEGFFIEIFNRWLYTALGYCKKSDKNKLCEYALKTLEKMDKLNPEKDYTLKLLKQKKYKDIQRGVKAIKQYRILGIPFANIKYCLNEKAYTYLFNWILVSKTKLKGGVNNA